MDAPDDLRARRAKQMTRDPNVNGEDIMKAWGVYEKKEDDGRNLYV
jgi:hypothetical protein